MSSTGGRVALVLGAVVALGVGITWQVFDKGTVAPPEPPPTLPIDPGPPPAATAGQPRLVSPDRRPITVGEAPQGDDPELADDATLPVRAAPSRLDPARLGARTLDADAISRTRQVEQLSRSQVLQRDANRAVTLTPVEGAVLQRVDVPDTGTAAEGADGTLQ